MKQPKQEKKKKIADTQQVSDKLASKVAKGTMSYRQASKIQRKADSVALSKTRINKVVSGRSANSPIKRKSVTAKHRRDKHGNIVRY